MALSPSFVYNATMPSIPLVVTRARRAFTLIELLVVISIIAVLAALAFPAIFRVRDVGYQAKSISNLKQIYVGAVTYSSDHDGWYPTDTIMNNGTPTGLYWRVDASFMKYLGQPAPTQSMQPGSVVRSGYPATPDPTNPYAGTIGYNNTDMSVFNLNTPSWMATTHALRNTYIVRPTKLIFFAEAVSSIINVNGRDAWTPEMDQGKGGGKYGVIAYRASGNTKAIAISYAGNILMIDRPASVGLPLTLADYERWRNYWPSSGVPAQ
jgi:prepilin-type N-terminal cleavage/methylation domain-containing protein